MGFFSGSSKTETKIELQTVPIPEEEDDDLLELPKPRAGTLIASGVKLIGKLAGEGAVQIEGIVDGEIELQGSVTVAPGGLVRGPITAGVVRVAGKVEGNVVAYDHLRLEKTGQLMGDVSTSSLVVEDGGCLDGRSTMLRPKQDSRSAQNRSSELEFGPEYHVGGADAPLI